MRIYTFLFFIYCVSTVYSYNVNGDLSMLNENTRSLQIIDDSIADPNQPSLYGISEIHVYPNTYKTISCILEGASDFVITEPTNVKYITVSRDNGNLTINQFPYSENPVTVKINYNYKEQQQTDTFTLIPKYYELVNVTDYIFYKMPMFECTDGPPDVSQAQLTFTGELTDVNKLLSRNDFIKQIPAIREYSIEMFYMNVTGYVKIPTDGTYTFTLSAAHGSRLYFYDPSDNNREIPIISYWGSEACKANSPEIRSFVDLNERVYGFKLEVYGMSRYGFSFVYKYENRRIESEIEQPQYFVPFQSNTKEFNLLRSIEFAHSHYIFSYNSYNKLPFNFYEGYSTGCTILNNENLPNGLIISNITIEGIPTEIMENEKEYQLICESEYSKTSLYSLYIKVLDNYKIGSLVKYMKVIGFDPSCSIPYNSDNNNDNNIQILIKRIETPIGTDPVTDLSINNNNNPNELRYGLSSDFLSDFAVNYDGYLKLENEGMYGFKPGLNNKGTGQWRDKGMSRAKIERGVLYTI